MKSLLLVGCGGFAGASLRYLVGLWALRVAKPDHWFHGGLLGTLTVNVIGCLAIGLLTGAAERSDLLTPGLRLFLIVGLLGGFTTFSAFGLEGFHLVRNADLLRALGHAGAHVVLGLAAVAVGFWLAR